MSNIDFFDDVCAVFLWILFGNNK